MNKSNEIISMMNANIMLGKRVKYLGKNWSNNLYNDPEKLSFILLQYKFAAKMASKNRRILELGCGEGIGVPILSEFALTYTGIDSDEQSIISARRIVKNNRCNFIVDNFIGKKYGIYNSIFYFDATEASNLKYEKLFFETIKMNLDENGIFIIGIPNILHKEGYNRIASVQQKIIDSMHRLFYNIFIFSLNEGIVHAGLLPTSRYLIIMGCYIKQTQDLSK